MALALHAIPTIYQFRDFAQAGGLLSYGASIADLYRQVGIYVGRILHGDKAADLPVMLPSKFELVINMGTAKARQSRNTAFAPSAGRRGDRMKVPYSCRSRNE